MSDPKRRTKVGNDAPDAPDAHEHGEREGGSTREDDLIGTSGSHTPKADLRAEEPSCELGSSSETSGIDA